MAGFPQAEWARWFPEVRAAEEPGTFEIGLVLAGAISGGAYTAGVVDYLVEALDRWHAAKGDPDVPQHKVVLRIITGASAGGMVGAIAGVALKHAFPPMTAGAPVPTGGHDGDDAANPLYRAWVKEVDIAGLLGQEDLAAGRVSSLLDCTGLERIARRAVDHRGPPPPPRPWLPDALPLVVTVTNLRGVPYHLHQRGPTGLGHDMLMHQDHMAFLLTGLGGAPAYAMPAPPDIGGYVVLDGTNDSALPQWSALATAALATGAFPVALAPRALERRAGDYDCRFPGCAASDGGTVTPLRPAWPPADAPVSYRFLAVDGGVMDNEPFEIARVHLAGRAARNPRRGDEANRAVIMVDPFCEPGTEGPADDSAPLTGVAGALFGALKNQSRFKRSELELAMDEDVYSRFLVAPSRSGVRGARAIASGGLGSFLGFFSEAYRHHDFMLGRKNCRSFLRSHFALPATNPLFHGRVSDRARERFHVPGDPTHLPIIPVIDDDAAWRDPPAWPVGALQVAEGDALDRRVAARVDAVYARSIAALRASQRRTDGSWWDRLVAAARGEAAVLWIAAGWRGYLRRALLDTVRRSLAAAVKAVDQASFPGRPPD